jgi:integrase
MRPTFKLILFARTNQDGKRPIMLRVTNLRKSKYYPLHRYCTPEQWDESAGRLRKSYKGYLVENDMLRTYEQRASDALRHFEREQIRFSFEAFERLVFVNRSASTLTLWQWIESIVSELVESGKHGNAKFYKESANTVKAYAPASTLSDIDSVWLTRFERWMQRERNLKSGGMSLHMRLVRAACNRAVKAGIMPKDFNPFEQYRFNHLKNQKAQKAIALADLWRLRDAQVYNKGERLALDLFMFSFYMRGINFADMAELRPSDIVGTRLIYTRKKTGKTYNLPLTPQAGGILDRYKGGEYLLPIYQEQTTDAEKFRRRILYLKAINDQLKVIAESVGIAAKGFSFYVARHTYANAHKQAGTSREVIRELMGHSDYKTAEHYLSAFGDERLDAADRELFGGI